jgi:hypothetical protein
MLLLVFCVQAEARNLGQLRSRVNWYLNDQSNLMLSSAIKDSIVNVSQEQYCSEFPVFLDTSRQAITVGQRFYSMPSNYAGRIESVHKLGVAFTEIPYVPTDTNLVLEGGVIQFYSVKQTKTTAMLVLYPNPEISGDTVFYFYHATPTLLTADSMECRIADFAEEPVVFLAVSKVWASKSVNVEATFWNQQYLVLGSRITRTKLEEQTK